MKPITVLLIDDNPAFLHAVTRFLQELTPEEMLLVGTAATIEEGLARAEALRPNVVLIDLMRPGAPASKLIAGLRRVLPRAGIAVVTADDATGFRREALRAGADELIREHHMSNELWPAIRRAAVRHEGSGA